ncbi:MAG: TnsA endonuclease N-terminal domain-containing protein [Campylobacterales bacterium]
MARKIPKNYRSVTGTFPSLKNGRSVSYESLLERDLFLLNEFDSDIATYEEQPFTIQYDRNGKNTNYTPDCLINYQPGLALPPCAIEVKFSDEIKRDKTFFEAKFAAIEDYLRANDMDFQIFTELSIRTVRLENARHIYSHAFLSDRIKVTDALVAIRRLKQATLGEIQDLFSKNPYERAEWLPYIWNAVAHGKAAIDMDEPITNSTLIRWRGGED